MIVVLFAGSYPYDAHAELTFLDPEIPFLTRQFEKVFLIPKVCKGEKAETPEGVEVDGSYAAFLSEHSRPLSALINAFSSKHFYQELLSRPTVLFRITKLLQLISFSSRSRLTKIWLKDWMRARRLKEEDCILYSYWFNEVAMGLGLFKQEAPQIKVISRAHGYDIYEEIYYPYYWPRREQSLAALDMLFPASVDGADYFRDRYPGFDHLIEATHLGVNDPEFICRRSEDGVFRIVSCAYIVPQKRVDLILKGIAHAARSRPAQQFEWLHFGGGHARTALQKMVKKLFPPNVKGRIADNMPNKEIMRFYQDNPVDVFINTSVVEGGAPVSIQEAISCGIPIIATNVGGNPEIVSERNGLLLSPNPSPREIGETLLQFWDDRDAAARMKRESRLVWQESYDARKNYPAFAERLKSIRQSS